MRLKNLTFALFLSAIFSTLTIQAQQLDHVLGDILVQLPENTSPEALLADFQTLNEKNTRLNSVEQISPPFNIWQLHFDFATISEHDMLRAIWKHKDVKVAQFNHLISYRAEPNDAQFADQWQYINTGQSGGTVGADIDMDLAWDITTGGLTAQGDTIVVCVLDDGLDLDHEDWGDNVWRNYAEIPDNGIDDDNNGYVDDYWGWNSNGTDNIDPFSGHGTPVSGIVGAQGNNEIGVSGVSWDVKVMMMVNSAGTEASVIEGYTYPLVQRQRYNDSNGEEGAFVVATNSSWGWDFGQPDEAPLWCGFYDTMGEAGILSCGATINGNQNVDEVGDLPTACPSDYLISVTNMNRNDVKVNGAGYGLETIDLGAFGQDTWTISNNNGYNGFGGTSGATPHVTGAIGLMYSAPCGTFIEYAKVDPAGAALLMKQYIYDGVDPNASLEGITTTGGRLNIRNSLDVMMANCGPCPPPGGLSAEAVTDVSADLSWISPEGTVASTLRWREVGTMDWTIVEEAVSPLSIDNLLACAEYEFQVSRVCTEEESDFSNAYTFLTDGCCDLPEELAVNDVTETSANLTWNGVLAALNYNVRYRPLNTSDWTEVTVTETNFAITGLINCTDYELQIATSCDMENTEYGESVTFLTSGCGACTENDYCVGSGNTADEYIESAMIGTINSVSGDDGGFGTFLGSPELFEAETAIPVSITPGYNGFEYTEVFSVYIDLDQNGAFTNDELLFEQTGNSTVTGELTIPNTATNGLTLLRIVMNYNEPGGPCDDLEYGEFEDYCIEITGAGLAPCEPPTNIAASPIDLTATITWDAVDGAASYGLRYVVQGQTDWQEFMTTDLTYTIVDLEYETTYDYEVKTFCQDGGESPWAGNAFTTEPNSLKDVFPTEIAIFQAAPNPTDAQVQVQFQLVESTDAVYLEVVNIAGQTVQSIALGDVSTSRQYHNLDLSKATAGMYFLRLRSAEWTAIQRVVKL